MHEVTVTRLLPACRVALASASRELRQWSTEHADELWKSVSLDLHGLALARRAYWAKVKWLEHQITHVHDLHLVIHQVRCACHPLRSITFMSALSASMQLLDCPQ